MIKILFKLKLILFFYIILLNLPYTKCGCGREGVETFPCESICNATGCELRIGLILPRFEKVEASIARVAPVLDLLILDLVPEYNLLQDIKINYTAQDDKCDASYSTISAMDAYLKSCSHLILGPQCEYALAAVGRIVKHFQKGGMPLITPAGFSYDYIKPKLNCTDEFYMMTRTGSLSFASISEFQVKLMQNYHWGNAVFFYERNGHYNVGGMFSCFLLMSSLAQYFRDTGLQFKSYVFESIDAINVTDELRRHVGVDYANAFFGPLCDYVIAPVSRYSCVWQIPVLTAGGLAGAFDYKSKQYQTLIRMSGGYVHVGKAVAKILSQFDWSIVGLLYHNHGEETGKGNSDCHYTLWQVYKAVNNTNSFSKQFNEETADYKKFKQLLEEFKDRARIIIMCGNSPTIREIMLAADELGMVDKGEYVFFNIELFSSMSNATKYPWHNKMDDDERNERARKAYTALLTVTAQQPEDSAYITFSDRVKQIADEKYNYTFDETEPVSTFVTAFYDSILLYAYALNDTIAEFGRQVLLSPINGSEIVKRMWNRTIPGITGDVVIDDNGDRLSNYSLLDMDPETGEFKVVANYLHDKNLEYVMQIHWAGGRTKHPPDKPKCGFDNSLCPDNSFPGYAILSIILGTAICLLSVISFLGYRHYKLEAEINSMSWRVNWNDVLPCCPNSKQRNSIYSLAKRGSQITVHSEDIGSLGGDKQVFIPIGFYKGNKVAIKRIDVHNINLNRSLMLQLKKMKDLQHEHLVRFYGACVEPADSCILTEYCPKGSLQDILENEQIKLDMMFKLSLMHDIVRGMHYLHTTDLHSHGTLKSSNCVVDSRFVLKITDFGLHELRKNSEQYEDDGSYSYWKKFLWTAPEILRMENSPPHGSQKGDIYSFGIIVHEIITRQGPFYIGENEKSPQEIVKLVKEAPKLFLAPFRPKIEDCSYEDINNMMVKCWSEDPSERPDFTVIKHSIRKINKENESGNILDNLLKRMEMYANNLEFLVEERTQDYLEEKRKCEELLYQLLPRSVASQLIMGQPVVAETYDKVTIYFSDIVGFTSISAESTPMQVVDFLNDLYTCFDSIIEHFDVYKVETIGDAYMVVSGLPVRNGDLHAREISRMALALLKAVRTFHIRHRPKDILKLRIGLHSGPCVAGVVGLKMPRYCLFGDTVNTASRMESNGEPLKIHISENLKKLLDKFGCFNVTQRGLVPMKGKGDMLTFWLEGETEIKEQTKDTNLNEIKTALTPPLTPTTTTPNSKIPTNGVIKNSLPLLTKEIKSKFNSNPNLFNNLNNLKTLNNQMGKFINNNKNENSAKYKKINNDVAFTVDENNLTENNLKNSNLTQQQQQQLLVNN